MPSMDAPLPNNEAPPPQQDNDEIMSLKRRLEEADDQIFELSAELETVAATKQRLLEQEQQAHHTQTNVLKDEIRVLQISINQLRAKQQQNNNNKRRITHSPTPTASNETLPPVQQQQPPPPSSSASSSSLVATSTTPTATTQLLQSPPSLTRCLLQLPATVDDPTYTQFLLSLSTLDDHETMSTILWYLLTPTPNNNDDDDTTTSETAPTYPLMHLLHFCQQCPWGCRLLCTTGGFCPNNNNNTTTLVNVDESTQQVLHRLQQEVFEFTQPQQPTSDSLTSAQRTAIQRFVRFLQQNWHTTTVLQIWHHLVPNQTQQQQQTQLCSNAVIDTLVDAWVSVLPSRRPRRCVRPSSHDATATTTTLSDAWKCHAVCLLTTLLSETTDAAVLDEQWLTTKRVSTLLAAALDYLEEQNDDHTDQLLRYRIVQFLQLLATLPNTLALLNSHFPTHRSTAQVWDRAPTACHVLAQVLYQSTVAQEYGSAPPPPPPQHTTRLWQTIVCFFQSVLHALEMESDHNTNNERQSPFATIYWIDLLGPAREYYASAAQWILERTKGNNDTTWHTHLEAQLDELGLDVSEKFADCVSS